MKRSLQVLLVIAISLLAFCARCWNARDVFLEGRIYFVDPDCYSRMTRAQMIANGSGWFIRHHDFENWPAGTTPHTTAPLDWLIVAGKATLDVGLAVFDPAGTSLLRLQTLDLAGALVGPVLGALTCGLLGWAGLRFSLARVGGTSFLLCGLSRASARYGPWPSGPPGAAHSATGYGAAGRDQADAGALSSGRAAGG